MNARIQELFNKCFIGTTDGKLGELNTVATVEKFAELLILECSYLVDQAHYKATGGINGGGYIRRHFDIQVLK